MLSKAAKIAIEETLKVQKGERVLIITNPKENVLAISQALYQAVMEVKGLPLIALQPEKSQLDFCDEGVIAAIASEPDVVISMTSEKMGKDKAGMENPYQWEGKEYDHIFHYLLYGKKTIRSFWSPGMTRDMFSRTVGIDYAALSRSCLFLKDFLDRAESVHISAPAGTDLHLGLKGRTAFVDDGDFSSPGGNGNLPAGETFISPENYTAEGTIVFDGSIAVTHGTLVINTPIAVQLEKGLITSISGASEAEVLTGVIREAEEKAEKLPSKAELNRKNARHLGELGIGLNPAAQIKGLMLEDEKAFKTCHIAIGKNYDGDADALIHLDGVIKDPTITVFFADGSSKVILNTGLIPVK